MLFGLNGVLTKYVSWELSATVVTVSLLFARAVHFPSLNPLPPSAFRPLTASTPRSLATFLPFLMSQPSSFQDIFNAALHDYKNQTGVSLADHTFAKQLETCNSVDSVTAILQEQAQIFREFKEDDGKIMKSLKSSVDVLYALSNSTVLGQGIGLVSPHH